MKKGIRFFIRRNLFFCFLFCWSFAANSQTVFFWFVAPASVISTNFGTPVDSVRCPFGYARVQIRANNKAKFNSIAPTNLKYVYAQMQPRQNLRKAVNLVLKNSAGLVDEVQYFLIDDRTALSSDPRDTSHIYVDYIDGGKKYVWPAANNNKSSLRKDKYVGWVMLGEHQLQFDQSQRTGRMQSVDEVVLHESSHTQFTGRWTKWGAVEGKAVTYGVDGMHYLNEIIGDQAGALNEGIATFYGYLLNDSAYQELVSSLSDTSRRYFVEARSVLGGDNELRKISDKQQSNLRNSAGNVFYPNGNPVVTFRYRWKTVPGWYLLFAEGTSTAFFSLFRNHTYQNKETAYFMIREASTAMSADRIKRQLTYACTQLALRMEAYNNSTKGEADKSRISSMFPYALLDLLTHFGMSDSLYKKDHRRTNPEKYSKAYTEYWNHRSKVQALVQTDIDASPIRFKDALQKIKDYFKKSEMILSP